MPDINSLFPSRYIRKEDLPRPARLKIADVIQEKIASDDGQEVKPVVYFEGHEKGLVLNRVNAELIVQVTGHGNTDNWPGCEICIFNDQTITFRGRVVGGVRVRPVSAQPEVTPDAARSDAAPSRHRTMSAEEWEQTQAEASEAF